MADSYIVEGGHAEIDASVGVAAGIAGAQAIADGMREADGAMYTAKRAAKARVVVAGGR